MTGSVLQGLCLSKKSRSKRFEGLHHHGHACCELHVIPTSGEGELTETTAASMQGESVSPRHSAERRWGGSKALQFMLLVGESETTRN